MPLNPMYNQLIKRTPWTFDRTTQLVRSQPVTLEASVAMITCQHILYDTAEKELEKPAITEFGVFFHLSLEDYYIQQYSLF